MQLGKLSWPSDSGTSQSKVFWFNHSGTSQSKVFWFNQIENKHCHDAIYPISHAYLEPLPFVLRLFAGGSSSSGTSAGASSSASGALDFFVLVLGAALALAFPFGDGFGFAGAADSETVLLFALLISFLNCLGKTAVINIYRYKHGIGPQLFLYKELRSAKMC